MSDKTLIAGAKATLAASEVVGACACGPTAKGSGCQVTLTEMDGKVTTRAALPGEFLPAGAWSGPCPKRDCVETVARAFPGSTTPEACGGVPPVVEAPKGVEAKP